MSQLADPFESRRAWILDENRQAAVAGAMRDRPTLDLDAGGMAGPATGFLEPGESAELPLPFAGNGQQLFSPLPLAGEGPQLFSPLPFPGEGQGVRGAFATPPSTSAADLDLAAALLPLTPAAQEAAGDLTATMAPGHPTIGEPLAARSSAIAATSNTDASATTTPSAPSAAQPASSTWSASVSTGQTLGFASGGGSLAAVAWTGGGALDSMSMGSEPAYVIDWNDGLTLSTGAVEYESEGDSVDLRAQVQGNTVASYSWDLSEAPQAANVSGADTYRLRFNWANIFSGNSASNHIELTVTYTDQTQTVLAYDFEVVNDGTAGSGGGTPVSVTRPEVVTPDRVSIAQDAIGRDLYQIGLTTGEFATGHWLPTYGPGDPGLGLVYNSEAAAPQPIFLERYELDPDEDSPTTVSARLTFNSVQGQEYYYDASDLNPGDLLQIALQADASSLDTGRYAWRIDVTAHYQGGDVSSYTTGDVTVINYADSPAGAGWQIAGLHRLVDLEDGAILDLGEGHSLWFAWDDQSQEYVTPPPPPIGGPPGWRPTPPN